MKMNDTGYDVSCCLSQLGHFSNLSSRLFERVLDGPRRALFHEGQMASGRAFGAGEMVSRGKGVEDKTENPSIGGKFKILLRLLAKRDLLPESGSSETGRGSYDD